MAQKQVTIDGLQAATVLSLQDEIELDQFNTDTDLRQSRKATLQQVATVLSGSGSPIVKITVADSPYSATIQEPIILADASGGAIIIVLPAITSLTPQMKIKKIDTSENTVTLSPQAGDTIELAANYVLEFAEQAVEPLAYIPDTNWNIL